MTKKQFSPGNIEYKELDNFDDFQKCISLQKKIFGFSDIDIGNYAFFDDAANEGDLYFYRILARNSFGEGFAAPGVPAFPGAPCTAACRRGRGICPAGSQRRRARGSAG